MIWVEELSEVFRVQDLAVNSGVGLQTANETPDLFLTARVVSLETEKLIEVGRVLCDHASRNAILVDCQIWVVGVSDFATHVSRKIMVVTKGLKITPNYFALLQTANSIKPEEIIERQQTIIICVVFAEKLFYSCVTRLQLLLKFSRSLIYCQCILQKRCCGLLRHVSISFS